MVVGLCRALPAPTPWGADLFVAPDGFGAPAYPDADPSLRKRVTGRTALLGPGRQAPAVMTPSEP